MKTSKRPKGRDLSIVNGQDGYLGKVIEDLLLTYNELFTKNKELEYELLSLSKEFCALQVENLKLKKKLKAKK